MFGKNNLYGCASEFGAYFEITECGTGTTIDDEFINGIYFISRQ